MHQLSFPHLPQNQDKTQITMLTTWLSEIFLNQLGELRENDEDMTAEYEQLQGDFRQLLANPKVHVSRNWWK